MNKIYIVYKIKNIINEKEYIGFHCCKNGNIDDGYMGSGKILLKSIEYHGIENFKKEVLRIFNSKKDAENYERELVNKEYTLRRDTYNMCEGGNLQILYGENNGFYGRKHKKESIDKIQKARSKTISGRGYFRLCKYACYIDGELFATIDKVKEKIGLKSIRKIIKYLYENDIELCDEDFKNNIERIYNKILINEEKSRLLKAEACSKRFKGIPKTEEHKERIGDAHRDTKKDWVSNIINKDPEKIRKTAEKHRGMKRTKETCDNISSVLKSKYESGEVTNSIKGKVCYYHYQTNELRYFDKEEIPSSEWIKGTNKKSKKCYYDPKTFKCKKFPENEQPDGWVLGNPKSKSKFYYDPDTLECKRFIPGTEPKGWVQGNPKLKICQN